MKIYNCCSLCIKESKNNGDDLIWLDSMQMCKDCYKKYQESDYNKQIMLINAIKKYRRIIEELLEENTNE